MKGFGKVESSTKALFDLDKNTLSKPQYVAVNGSI
jgi:hypothetical protein